MYHPKNAALEIDHYTCLYELESSMASGLLQFQDVCRQVQHTDEPVISGH